MYYNIIGEKNKGFFKNRNKILLRNFKNVVLYWREVLFYVELGTKIYWIYKYKMV